MTRDEQPRRVPARSTVNASELFPLVSKTRAPLANAFFAPVALTLVTIALLWWARDIRVMSALLVIWLGSLSLMFLHILGGRHRPVLWLFGGLLCGAAGAASIPIYLERFGNPATTAALAARLPTIGTEPFLDRVWFWLTVAGLPEEFVKAIPVALAVALGVGVRSVWGRRLGVLTPLDGVLLGAAAGIGFTCEESFSYAAAAAESGNQLGAVLQVLNRNVGQFGSHPAWAGYTGYCLGLGVVRRRHLPLLAIGGWLLSSMLHATYNATAGPGPRAVQLAVIIGSWALFAAAVLKARQMQGRAAAVDVTAVAVASPAASHVPADESDAVVWGQIGTSRVQWRLGDRVLARDVGLAGAGAGDAVAEVVAHPTDRHVVGLRNLSGLAWTAIVAPGEEQLVEPGRSLRLAPGVRLTLGTTQVAIEKVR